MLYLIRSLLKDAVSSTDYTPPNDRWLADSELEVTVSWLHDAETLLLAFRTPPSKKQISGQHVTIDNRFEDLQNIKPTSFQETQFVSPYWYWISQQYTKKQTLWPTERPMLVGEVTANFRGYKGDA
jgi:hypothetical protein